MGETVFPSAPRYRVGGEFAVEKPLDGGGLPLEFPSIEEELGRLVLGHSIKHLQKSPLGLFQRELPCNNHVKPFESSTYSEDHAHPSPPFPVKSDCTGRGACRHVSRAKVPHTPPSQRLLRTWCLSPV